MDYAFMGRTGVQVSRLALGTMTFGGDADDATSAQIFAACRDAGVNFFDCADVYNDGRSEEILGRLVRGCRDQIVLTTKAYFPTGPDVNARGTSRYHLVRAVEASLRRLGTDRIDLLFLHRWDDATPIDETLRAVDDLVRRGSVLYVGASNFAAWQAMKALGVARREGLAPLVCLQPMYNAVKRQAEVEILPMAQAESLAVVPYSPLAGGLLTGKYRGGSRPDSGRILRWPLYKARYAAPETFAVADAFAALADEAGVHPVSLAVAWVAAHPAVTAPLLGARTLDQLRPALAALDVAMTPELRARVSALTPEPPPATDRNEERDGVAFAAKGAAAGRRV